MFPYSQRLLPAILTPSPAGGGGAYAGKEHLIPCGVYRLRITALLRPQSDGLGRALLGMSPPNLREVPSTEIRFSTVAGQIVAQVSTDYPIPDPKCLK